MRRAPSHTFQEKKGFILPGVIIVLLIFALFVPAMVLLIQKDTKESVSEAAKTVAMQLAEAGQDRAAWKLRESGQIWLQASSGTVIDGYNNDVEYTDTSGGKYKIQITSGPNDGEVTVVSKGLTTGSNVLRAIQAVYSKSGDEPIGALTVNSALEWKANMTVHWGPVITYNSITSDPGEYFPRKYSAGKIEGRDTTNNSNNGALPGDNWSTYDYVAYYDLGVAPTIDLDEYRERAKALTGIPAMKNGVQTPAGSGYFTGANVWIEKPVNPKDYKIDCTSCVIFIEGTVGKFPNKAEVQVEALLVTGNMDFNADTLDLTVQVPCSASDEYQHTSLGSYFSDRWTNCANTTINNVGMQGFLYVGGNMNNAGGGAILNGALYLVGTMSINTFTIYYNEAIAAGILTGGTGQTNRDSWDEILTSW